VNGSKNNNNNSNCPANVGLCRDNSARTSRPTIRLVVPADSDDTSVGGGVGVNETDVGSVVVL